TDDDYIHGGGNLHSLYDVDDQNKDGIVADFLIFCKFAVKRGVIPTSPAWDWSEFLRIARPLPPFAFEKSDAKEKYGSENVFSVLMGGRSLRYTGEQIYGTGVQSMGNNDPVYLETRRE
ncbi:hypothetical protein HK102_008962, partial [Quaeritorhiza haematococci]